VPKVLEEWKLEGSSLKVLSLKLSMRFPITTSQRLQTLKALCINKMNLKSDQCSFEIDVLLKISQPGKHLNKVVIAAYPGNKILRPVQHLKSYMKNINVEMKTYPIVCELPETTHSCFNRHSCELD
jgi:hypothetical protein